MHAGLWYLFGDARISRSAKTFIDEAADSGRKVVLSVISLAEIIYLIEKNRSEGDDYAFTASTAAGTVTFNSSSATSVQSGDIIQLVAIL